jgi:hypothetical protein
VGQLGERLVRLVGEVRVRPLPAAPDPAADLVQLGQAEASARSTISVLAFGMSSPDSTIVVQTRTS